MDNVTAVSYINQKRGTISRLLCQLAITFWTWCTERNITLIAEHLPGQRSRQGIQDSEGSLRLETQPSHISTDTGSNGSTGCGPVCVSPDETASPHLQLEARSGGGSNGCLHAGLVDLSRIRQPTMVPDRSMPHQGEKANSSSGINNTTVENPTMVPYGSGAPGRLPLEDPTTAGSSVNASGGGLSDATGSTPVGRLAYLRESYASRGLSSQASDLMLLSWRDKTNSNYGSSFSRWASWCHQRGRDPLSGPIEDVVNFLAGLFSEGYQYQSLNAYRSAISSTHDNVDGVSVGSHPAVTRLLKGAFHS